MITVVASARGYRMYRDGTILLVQAAIVEGGAQTIVLDFDSIASSVAEESVSRPTLELHRIDFSDWLDGHRLSRYAIIQSAKIVTPDEVVIVEADAYPSELISEALVHIRTAWFHLDDWQKAFVLVCEDSEVPRLGAQLNKVFTVSRKPLTKVELQRMVNATMRRGLVYRWFGMGKLTKIATWLVKKVRR